MKMLNVSKKKIQRGQFQAIVNSKSYDPSKLTKVL